MDTQRPNCDTTRAHSTHGFCIQIDFDGTIVDRDVCDALLEKFAPTQWQILEEQWLSQKINAKQCMQGQIKLLSMSKPAFLEYLSTIQLDPYFKTFLHFVRQHNIFIEIVSDGLDQAIHSILQYHQISGIPITSNRLIQTGETTWDLYFPNSTHSCTRNSGTCKCAQLQKRKAQQQQIIYIGDGASDFCVAKKSDIVYAKNALIPYCQTQHIPFYPVHDFGDVLHLLSQLYAVN